MAALRRREIPATQHPMTRPLPVLARLLGVAFLVIAAVYWLIPAPSLPSFFPGFKMGSVHVHFKNALGSLVLALALLAFAWLQDAPGRR
jgi:hypothetical protein